MIDIEDMRCFVAVVDSGGFSRAAARLGISKSMVSRRISAIEDDLQTRLLSRTTRGISPTDAGLEFMSRSERIIAEFDEARAAVALHSGEVIGRLRVSLPLSFGVRHIAPILAELAQQHPHLEIDASFTDRRVDLIGERYDAAIRIGALHDSSLIARRLAPVRSTIVASPAYLHRKGRPRTPADLTDHEFIMSSGRTNEIRLRAGKRWLSIRPKARLLSDNGEVLVRWATEGLGIAVLPSFLVSEDIEAGRLEPLLADYMSEEFGIFVVRPPGPNVPGKVRVLTDRLVERLGGDPIWDKCLMAARERRA